MTARRTLLVILTVALTAALLMRVSEAEDGASNLPLRVRQGFRVERVYSVPRESQGSWVALAVDGQGRLIASDQNGGLYRVTLNASKSPQVEPIDLPVGHAHGLLFASGSLYAVVAENEHQGPGLYRVQDTDGDDVFDRVTLLQSFHGTGEHGPHSVVLSPDGESLFVVAGNKTVVPNAAVANSMVPTHWGEDDLLPRLWGPIGSEVGTPAPGGWIASVDGDGKRWQLRAVGLRNAFDLAFNQHGELFTVDADAEFDLGTPWYQPTRVLHVVDGTDYGWRSGAGKWPPYYADTLPPVVELGPGSPTGVAFAHKTNFPERYRNRLFVGDWSRGQIVAVELKPDGGAYLGAAEEIVSGTPLPVTDLLVHPGDGAIYFTIGGRGATSALYRLVWAGDHESGAADDRSVTARNQQSQRLRELRTELSSLCKSDDHRMVVRRVWPYLGHEDRTLRHAARIALENTPPDDWRERALAEPVAAARLTALLALARADETDSIRQTVKSVCELNWKSLSHSQRLAFLRCLDVAFTRGKEQPLETRRRATRYLAPLFPTGRHQMDAHLCRLLVFLDSPHVPKVAVPLMETAATSQQQLGFAATLRHQRSGWTQPLRERYFSFLGDAGAWQGGLSLQKYVEQIGKDALLHVPDAQRERLASLLSRPEVDRAAGGQRPFVRKWTLADLASLDAETIKRGDAVNGRKLFGEAQCFACHRFQGEGGGVGPDLTTVSKRLSVPNLLEAIVEPSRVISDQFAASTIVTVDGQVIDGRVVNLVGDALLIQEDMLAPAKLRRVRRDEIEEMRPSKTSMMPTGLLDTLSREEVVDLLAFCHGL